MQALKIISRDKQILVGEKLHLRPLEDSGIGDEYLSWLNNPEVTRYLEAGKFLVTLSDLRKYLEQSCM